MSADLKAAIVRILKPDDLPAGTGFVVSDDGLIITCAHVVSAAGAVSGGTVRIVFHANCREATATVESEGWRLPEAEDTAFLQLSRSLPQDVIPAALGVSAGRSGAQIQAFGYPDLGKVEGLWGKGELIGPVTEARRPLLQLRSDEITAGFSGAPVWDVTTGHVIGMVTQIATPDRYGKLGEVAFAIPSETLAALASLPLVETDPLTEMRTSYLASLHQRFEYLDLGGIAPRVQNRTVKLHMADVFVPLQSRPEVEARFDLPDFMADFEHEEDTELAFRMLARSEREASARPMDLPELLGKPRAVILGDPGSGKSTLLRHVAFAIAGGDGKAVGEAALTRLPIFVRIIQYSQARAADPALTLDRYVREVSAGKWAPLFQSTLDAGGALLLLDGLDEVIDAHQRKEIAEAINTLAADYPVDHFLVTSRIVGYQAARLAGDFAHYTVQPLPPERIAEFVEKWYAAIEREVGETGWSEEARQRAAELSETIEARPDIRRLAENPLLLTIIALVNWCGRKLPNRRVELYAHAAETLIESWPYRRAGVRLETERVIRLLSPVAYRIFAAHSAGDMAEDELLPVLADAICRVDGVDRREAYRYSREFLSQVSEHSGIFRERGYDGRGRRIFGFLHLTFAEYFTARYLAGLWEGQGDDAEVRRAFLRRYAHIPRWHEVMLLMAGDVGMRDNDQAERATRLLSDLLQLGSNYEEHLQRDLLLAGECMADDLRVQDEASNYVIERLLISVLKPGIGEPIRGIFRMMCGSVYHDAVLTGLITQLNEQDSLGRAGIARTLGAMGDAGALDALLALLKDTNWLVRASAASALGSLGDVRAIEPLLALLRDSGWTVRQKAAEALGALGSGEVVESLLSRLQEKTLEVQVSTASALKALGSEVDVNGLLARLGSRDSCERATVARALGYIGQRQAVRPLLSLLTDENAEVRARAVSALGQIGDLRAVEPLIVLLKDSNQKMCQRAASALGRLGDARAVVPLISRLEDSDGNIRHSVASALGRIGDVRAVEPLTIRLQDKIANVRQRAASALGRIADARAVEPLIACLGDRAAKVRWSAASALAHIQDIRAVEPLIASFRDDTDKNVRWRIARALSHFDSTKSIEPLLEGLKDPDPNVRRCAAMSLGQLGDLQAVEPLLDRLDKDSADVQGCAYTALESILSRNALEPEVKSTLSKLQPVPGPWSHSRME